jgi:glycosyltransferase involved in cell wall biosynthesis
LLCFYLFLISVLVRIKRYGRFHIIFINSVTMVPYALIFKLFARGRCIQFDLMGILSEEKFLKLPKKSWHTVVKKIFSSFEDLLWSQVDFITTINDQHKHILRNRIRRPIYVIRDGVFESFLKHPPVEMKYPLYPSTLVLIFIGQINHFRLDPLFKVLPDLITELPNLKLHVLGAGPQEERYKAIVKSLRLSEHVIFYGHVPYEEIADSLAKSDIAYTDDWSIIGFPMKLFDYMALGKAIVAEGTESIKELVTDQVNGLLYLNETELKEKILKLAKDTALRGKLGKAAKGMMSEHTWEKRVETLKDIYQKFSPGAGMV